MSRIRLGLLAGALALIAGACSSSGGGAHKSSDSTPSSSTPSSSSSSATPFDISGTLTLYGEISTTQETPAVGETCFGIHNDTGDDNYEDIAVGANVTVYDENRNVVGAGTVDSSELNVATPLSKRACAFKFSASQVEPGHRFYTIEVGNHESDRLTQEELEAGPSLSIKSLTYVG